ncbi:outer membrane lipoprotein carrier protein LolA [Haloarcula sp. S1CR25-12]|uniref:Outer membrane lipoprotein carrier protein LolA n=1 Tax=Haloarcula saliterrae TaxID=2950534 RepID=A0ABU2FF07_9EURY|nr:outer membrane lipoprotein carrier protein LolA [Haloarcula sp. S1CR25-12]MDS0260300.1 outer membrane lipoprotein carrier protein LolA [Haloarcula sp. S1CR25-12]
MPSQSSTQRISTDRLVLAVTGLLITAVLVVAVWSAGVSSVEKPPPVDVNVSERYQSLDGIEATRTTVIERNGTVQSRTAYDATTVPTTGERRLRLSSGTSRYDLRVSNGSVLWLHDEDRAVVTRIRLSGPSPTTGTADRVQRLLVRANLTATSAASDTRPAVEPLPVVPEDTSPGGPGLDTEYTVRYGGNETVDGRETYVVHVTPGPNQSEAGYRQTLWIDTEWFYPLKRQTTWRDDGTRTELTTTYTDVTFNPDIPAGTFTPEIGPNTTVEPTDAPETQVYRRPSALRANTTVPVPEPTVPPSYELAYATHTDGSVQGVGLRYVNQTSWITVSKYNFTYPVPDGGERRYIDGRPALLTRGSTVTLSWNCGTYRYTLRGSGVTADLLVAVARSVGCPGA